MAPHLPIRIQTERPSANLPSTLKTNTPTERLNADLPVFQNNSQRLRGNEIDDWIRYKKVIQRNAYA